MLDDGLTFGSLFAGIGGLDLGLERAGMHCEWQGETDDYATKVLEKHWPDVARFRDVRDCHGTGFCDVADTASCRCSNFASTKTEEGQADERSQHERVISSGLEGCGSVSKTGRPCPNCLPPVDLICGGFPCQDVSLAGKRAGLAGKRSTLWSEFARIIRELRPRWVLAENVPGLYSSDSGRFFGRVLRDLAESGYDAEWDCIPAAAVGAPHRRYRVFIVAHRRSERRQQESRSASGDEGTNEGWSAQDHHIFAGDGQGGRAKDVAHANRTWQLQSQGSQRKQRGRVGDSSEDVADAEQIRCKEVVKPITPRTPEQGTASAAIYSSIPTRGRWWSVEPDVGRVAHGIPSRVDRLRCLGNAVVPQVAEWLGRCILAAEQQGRLGLGEQE